MEDIMKKLEKAVKSAAGEEYEVSICETRKNNGVILKQVSIRRPEKNAVQKMHINEILEMIASGRAEVDEAAGLIVKTCRQHEQEAENLERMTRGLSKSEIFKRVTGQVVNKMFNAGMLMEVPYKTVLDMALNNVYRYSRKTGEIAVV